jgi:hypothetical protein
MCSQACVIGEPVEMLGVPGQSLEIAPTVSPPCLTWAELGARHSVRSTPSDGAHTVGTSNRDAQRSGRPNYGSEGWGLSPSGRTAITKRACSATRTGWLVWIMATTS